MMTLFLVAKLAVAQGYHSNTYQTGNFTNTNITGNNGYSAQVQGYDYGNGFKSATATDNQGNRTTCQTYTYGNGMTSTTCN